MLQAFKVNKYSAKVNESGLRKPEQSETSCQSLLGPEKIRIIHESRRSVARVRVRLFQVTIVEAKSDGVVHVNPSSVLNADRVQGAGFGSLCARARRREAAH